MDKKLTLSLNESVIEKAKLYAQHHEISLSRLIESYLSSLIENKTQDIEITPLVESLSGVVHIPSDFDLRNDYTDHLLEKYK
ncbi:MAG: hypothetical protein DA408_16495 [Bacteroidetes bacterium]|nr:MAG: hypothetical protein C7N36_00030 [Bacteroidota bacterium]PTM10236.1 MAG: hypothetical protein DA408_16495 [Bacteroidota bacterium]